MKMSWSLAMKPIPFRFEAKLSQELLLIFHTFFTLVLPHNRPTNTTTPEYLQGPFLGELAERMRMIATSRLRPIPSWWFSFNPSAKYAHQIGSFPQIRLKIKNV